MPSSWTPINFPSMPSQQLSSGWAWVHFELFLLFTYLYFVWLAWICIFTVIDFNVRCTVSATRCTLFAANCISYLIITRTRIWMTMKCNAFLPTWSMRLVKVKEYNVSNQILFKWMAMLFISFNIWMWVLRYVDWNVDWYAGQDKRLPVVSAQEVGCQQAKCLPSLVGRQDKGVKWW